LQNLNPNLKYGIAPVPQLAVLGGVTSVSDDTQLTDNHWASYWTEGVNRLSQHKEEAWKFLEYLSSPEVLEKLYTAQSQIRSFGEIYPRKSMTDKLKENQKVWPFLSVANQADTWYLSGETGDDGVNSEMQKYFTDAINSISRSGGVATTEMMTNFKNGIRQVQQKYNLRK
jgi:ABC-type glycerol-3-phosphate transport system substrate-binding protein